MCVVEANIYLIASSARYDTIITERRRSSSRRRELGKNTDNLSS
jgi:hypothetical protein